MPESKPLTTIPHYLFLWGSSLSLNTCYYYFVVIIVLLFWLSITLLIGLVTFVLVLQMRRLRCWGNKRVIKSLTAWVWAWLWHLPALWPWATCLTSLCLSLLFCTMIMKILSASWVVRRINEVIHRQHCAWHIVSTPHYWMIIVTWLLKQPFHSYYPGWVFFVCESSPHESLPPTLFDS